MLTHEHKKAHTVSSSNLDASLWYPSSPVVGSISPNDRFGSASSVLTDNPLLRNNHQEIHNPFLPHAGFNFFEKEAALGPLEAPVSATPEATVSPPLSLSPLGPKFHESRQTMPRI